MKFANLLAAAAALVFLSGCLMTRSQIREQNDQTQTIQQTKAQSQAHYSDLDEQMRTLRGRLDVVENNQNSLRAERDGRDQQRRADQSALDSRLKIYEETLSKLESQYLSLAQKVETLAANGGSSSSRKSSSTSTKSTYETAEANFQKKAWKDAIVEYQKYRDRNPKGRHYSESTYKIGVCFQELGMRDEAKSFYSEVIAKFPKTKSADKAKIRLKQIK